MNANLLIKSQLIVFEREMATERAKRLHRMLCKREGVKQKEVRSLFNER